MIKVSVKSPSQAAFTAARVGLISRMERDALLDSHRRGLKFQAELRDAISGAKLGRVGNVFGHTSDLKRGTILRRGNGTSSASSIVSARSNSERTLGLLESYLGPSGTQVTITPRNRSGLLWIPTADIKRLVGVGSSTGGANRSGNIRGRLTPGLWNTLGLDRKIGPLVRITAGDGTPILIVERVGLNAAGKPGSVRSLKRNGQARKGDVRRKTVVAFIGIPRTSRTRRVDPITLARRIASDRGTLGKA